MLTCKPAFARRVLPLCCRKMRVNDAFCKFMCCKASEEDVMCEPDMGDMGCFLSRCNLVMKRHYVVSYAHFTVELFNCVIGFLRSRLGFRSS